MLGMGRGLEFPLLLAADAELLPDAPDPANADPDIMLGQIMLQPGWTKAWVRWSAALILKLQTQLSRRTQRRSTSRRSTLVDTSSSAHHRYSIGVVIRIIAHRNDSWQSTRLLLGCHAHSKFGVLFLHSGQFHLNLGQWPILLADVPSLPALTAFHQFANFEAGKDSRQAATPQDNPSSIISFTASCRNSFVYLPCGIPFTFDTPVCLF